MAQGGKAQKRQLSVAVVTSTIARPVLKQTIESVANQTRKATHYVFVHGEQYWDDAKKILEGTEAIGVYLPNNNGGDGYGMAPVYALAPYVVKEDILLYLDDDNFFEPEHVQELVDLIESNDLDWAYSLRRIVDDLGNLLFEDDCESLGYFPNASNLHITDNSCYAVKTTVARMFSAAWHVPVISDRNFLKALLDNKRPGGCTGNATSNYRLSKDGSGSMSIEAFINNNKVMQERYNGNFPWRAASVMRDNTVNSDKRKAHLFVATPMYGGMCTGYFTNSMISMAAVMRHHNVDMSFSSMFNESLIQRGRNALADQFLQRPECTHLLFIDADIKFDPNDIPAMIDADVDIICGIYPKKEINWHSVEKAAKNGVPVNEWTRHTGSLVVNLVDYAGTVTVPRDQPVEIWNGGTGFMLIKREVFEGLKDKVGSYVNDVAVINGNISARITEYFACSIEPGTERLLSEDYHFCKVARDNGYKIYAAPWVTLGHFGTYLFEGTLIPAP